MSAPAVTEISTERLILRRSGRRNVFDGFDGKLVFTHERMAPFHGCAVELWAMET